MSDGVEKKLTPSNALPFGFHGHSFLKTNSSNNALASKTPVADRLGGVGITDANLAGAILPPVPYRYKVTRGEMSGSLTSTIAGYPGPTEQANASYYWGVKFERDSSSSSSTSTSSASSNRKPGKKQPGHQSARRKEESNRPSGPRIRCITLESLLKHQAVAEIGRAHV